VVGLLLIAGDTSAELLLGPGLLAPVCPASVAELVLFAVVRSLGLGANAAEALAVVFEDQLAAPGCQALFALLPHGQHPMPLPRVQLARWVRTQLAPVSFEG